MKPRERLSRQQYLGLLAPKIEIGKLDMAAFAGLDRARPQGGSTSPAQIQNSSTPASSQRNKLTAEDLFNYLYGYTPIRLVDPVQLQQRRRQATQLENGTSNKAISCEYLSF